MPGGVVSGRVRRTLHSVGTYAISGAVVVLIAVLATACSPSAAEWGDPSLPSTTQTPPPPTTSIPETTNSDTTDTGSATETEEPIRLSIDDDFQMIVDAAPEGSVFIVEAGVHRLQEVQPKSGMTFTGLPGSVMNGAVELEGWTSNDGSTWRVEGFATSALQHGECVEGYEGCQLTQDLYMDDVMLWQVTSADDLAPGRWYWDGDSIVVADDPASRRVELSMATHAFVGSADDVTIRGLVVEKYAVPAQFGAIQSDDSGDGAVGRGWVVEDTEVRLNHGVGIRAGEGTVLRRVFVHHNGQLGIAFSGGTGGLIEDCEIAWNNTAGFNWGWEGGGAKFTETVGLVVRRTSSHDNDGPGLWTDISNYDTLYEENVVTNNSAPGIFHEISYDAVIRNNTVTGNGFGSDTWLWGSGILVAASSDVEIYGNTVTGNADGIGGIQQDREDGPEGPYLLSNLFVHSNTVSVDTGHTGIVEDNGDSAVFTDRDNRFEANTYVDTEGTRFFWKGRKLSADEWMNEGQDIEGVWR